MNLAEELATASQQLQELKTTPGTQIAKGLVHWVDTNWDQLVPLVEMLSHHHSSKKNCHLPYPPGSDLDPTVQAFIDAQAKADGPPIYSLTPSAARDVLNKIQAMPVPQPEALVQEQTITTEAGSVQLTIVRPSAQRLPLVMYFHGGGWILGNFGTHERLVRDLAVGANVAIVFVSYTPAPEARYPTQLNQAYLATAWAIQNATALNVDPSRLILIGDSVGGNMTTIVAMLGQRQGTFNAAAQVLLYPVTDAHLKTKSYCEFADGPWLTKKAMEWYWQSYLPEDRKGINLDDPTISPLRASPEILAKMPTTLLITDENDVLRDEGEAYGNALSKAGVYVERVRMLGTCHDFMMLNPLAESPATRAAITQVVTFLERILT